MTMRTMLTILGAAMLSAAPVLAQPGGGTPRPDGVPRGVPGGIPGGVPGGVSGGVSGGAPGGVFGLPPGTGVLLGPGAPIGWEEAQRDRAETQAERERERERQARQRESELYDSGHSALDEDRWDRALDRFSRVISMDGAKVDAAMYWKAYAQNRLGQRAEALATIAELIKAHPNSRYVGQARQLEAEVRRDAGQPARPESQADEELQTIAIQSLMQQDPERAVPVLEKIINDPKKTPKLKARALFVLAQVNSAAARQVLGRIASGQGNPDLQRKAIQYLGIHGGRESRELLAEIYASSADIDVKRRILSAFMVSGERQKLLTAAQSEKEPELRSEAVRQLGVMGAHDELWQLYTKESSRDVKKQILQAMFVGGNAERLIQLAKTESDPELRRTAVRNLGLIGARRSGDALVEIYGADRDPEIKKAVIQALFISGNAERLVALARKETDTAVKREIVSKLSLMGSNKAAMDYLMELIEK